MRMVRKGLCEKVIKLRTEKYEGTSHVKQSWRKITGKEKSKCKDAEVGKCLNA